MIRQILINRSRILHRHPLSLIAHFMMMRLITRISPRTILGIAATLATLVSNLIYDIGPLRTIRILLGIRQALNMEATIRVLRDILSGRANEVTVKEIVKILDPEWLKLVKKNITFIKLINVMIFITSSFLFIKPAYTLIIRSFFVTFFAIFGIVYTPILSSYKFRPLFYIK